MSTVIEKKYIKKEESVYDAQKQTEASGLLARALSNTSSSILTAPARKEVTFWELGWFSKERPGTALGACAIWLGGRYSGIPVTPGELWIRG